MSISLVNFSGGGQQMGPFTTVVSPAQSVASGNSLVVGIRWSATNVADNAGNTYIALPHLVGTATALGEGFQFFYCNNCVGNSALQVTATLVSTSLALDTYTAIAVWNIAGGPLTLDSNLISIGGSGSTQTFSNTTRYQNSITCLMDIATSGLATYGVNSPLTLDGGSSLGGQQIAAASHVINANMVSAQSLSMTSSISGTWQIGGPTFGLANSTPIQKKRKSFAAAIPATGRVYSYYITLERLF